MATTAMVIVAIVFGIVGLLYWQFPEATRRWFERIQLTRQVVWGLFLLGVAFVMLNSGIPSLILGGAIVLGYAVLYAIYEKPHEIVRDAVGI